MWKTLGKIIKDSVTENDGHSFDIVRISGALLVTSGVPTFIWGTIYTTLHEGHMNFEGFATAFGGMCAGVLALAGGVSVKQRSDQIGNPQSPTPPTGTP
jgi:hypothetical protein